MLLVPPHPPNLLDINLWILVIESIGSVIIIGYVIAALITLLRTRDIVHVRLLVASGALWGLSFKVAATLLKTIIIHTWEQIAFFAIILALRTLIKWVFTWEQARLNTTATRQSSV